jgi:hypothetical protein
VQIVDVKLAGDMPPLRRQNDNNRWVYVTAVVTNTTDETWLFPKQVLRLSGVDGLLSEQAYDTVFYRDRRSARNLQPDMPEKIAYFWEQSGDAPAPTTATVLVQTLTWREDSLTREFRWFDPEVAAEVVVPVTDTRTTS